jgi:glycosyltransferase involved in cell wall biosynthesis
MDRFVEEQGIRVHRMDTSSKWGKLQAVRRWLKEFAPEVMHGCMKRASSLAILANLRRRRCRVVASDFSTASYGRHKPELWPALVLFAMADMVVTETEMNRRNLGQIAPWLRRKTRVIRNGVDTVRFQPTDRSGHAGPFRFACVGTVYAIKNPVRVVEAVRLLREQGESDFVLSWHGRAGLGNLGTQSPEYVQATELVRLYGLQGMVNFLGESEGIEKAYGDADALVHVSVQEGIPNAVVEAMACGLPVIVSQVSDLPLLVQAADNGFVCDEKRPEAIAEAMRQMLRSTVRDRLAMGERSRRLALEWFGRDRFIDDFEQLYQSLLTHRR